MWPKGALGRVVRSTQGAIASQRLLFDTFPSSAESLASVRDAVRAGLGLAETSHPPAVVENAVSAVNELAAAGASDFTGGIQVTVESGSAIRLEVVHRGDGSRQAVGEISRRLLDQLTRAWGEERAEDGWRLWAEVG